MKLISWNVNGLRAIWRKGFPDLLAQMEPDILCLQEIKITEEQALEQILPIAGYAHALSPAEKKGYSGVATLVRDSTNPKWHYRANGIAEKRFDQEGRFAITDHGSFLLYNIYFPSGTTGTERQDFKYEFLETLFEHLNNLPKRDRERLVICGDYNICHRPIDIHHPREAERRELSGFLPDERAWMDRFAKLGFVDTYRHMHGDKAGQYSWWTYRAGARGKNLGWRIDYFFVSKKLVPHLKHATIHADILGSDHCPVSVELGFG